MLHWYGIEFRHLAALAAVAEKGSFHAAARALGYTQSAISQQIAALERTVGQRLIQRPRTGERVSLTRAGTLLLSHTDAIAAHLSAARADLDDLVASGTDLLRVGVYQSAGSRLLPRILHEFIGSWPLVAVELTEAVTDGGLYSLIEAGELDIAFAILPPKSGPFESVELLRDRYVLLVPRDAELATRDEPPSLRDLASLPLICFRDCRSLERVLAVLSSSGVEPRPVLRSNDNGTIQGFVAAGLGFGLVPSLSVSPDERLAVIELDAELPRRLTGLVFHRERSLSPAAVTFIEIARKLCAGLEPAGAAERRSAAGVAASNL
jgi:DNA-binding transcriptional LysR family regulator